MFPALSGSPAWVSGVLISCRISPHSAKGSDLKVVLWIFLDIFGLWHAETIAGVHRLLLCTAPLCTWPSKLSRGMQHKSLLAISLVNAKPLEVLKQGKKKGKEKIKKVMFRPDLCTLLPQTIDSIDQIAIPVGCKKAVPQKKYDPTFK